MDPIAIMMESARFLRSIAAAHGQRFASTDAILAASKTDLDFIRKFLVDASNIAYKAAEFGYAKLQRIDYVGDAPTTTVENKIVVMLKIGDDPRGDDSDASDGSRAFRGPAAGAGTVIEHDSGRADLNGRQSDDPNRVPSPVAVP